MITCVQINAEPGFRSRKSIGPFQSGDFVVGLTIWGDAAVTFVGGMFNRPPQSASEFDLGGDFLTERVQILSTSGSFDVRIFSEIKDNRYFTIDINNQGAGSAIIVLSVEYRRGKRG